MPPQKRYSCAIPYVRFVQGAQTEWGDDITRLTPGILKGWQSCQDSLYDFVRARCDNDLRFSSLFEFIDLESLNIERIEKFAFFASESFLEKINLGIWRQICGRCISEANPKEMNPH